MLKDIVDKHAPEKSRVGAVRAEAPWYTSELVKEQRLRRKLERKYNKTKLAVDKERLDHQPNIYNHLLTQAKQNYFKTKFDTAETSKDLHKVCDNLLNRKQKSVLPSHGCVKDLADKFVTYFNDKISKYSEVFRKSTDINITDSPRDIFNKFDREVLDSFIRGWYQENYSFITNKILCPRPYTYVAAQEMWGWIDTCTHINSEYILVVCRVSQGT